MPKFKLAKLFDAHRGKALVSMILTVVSVLAGLVTPMILAFVIDGVLMDSKPRLPAFLQDLYQRLGRDFFLRHLWIPGLAMILIYLIQAYSNYQRNLNMSIFAQEGTRKLRNKLYAHLHELPLAWHKQAETGDLVQRCTSDVRQVSNFFDRQLMRLAESGLSFILVTYLMLRFDLKLGLIALTITPVVFILCVRYFKKRQKTWILWEEAEGALSARLQETVTGIRVVKAFGREDYEHEAFLERNQNLYTFGMKNFRVMGNFWFWINLICYGELALIVVLGTYYVVQGLLTPGVLVLFTFYAEKLIGPLRNFARLIAATGTVKVAAGRLEDILSSPAEPDESDLANPELTGAIRFENVSFAYPDDQVPVLHNLDLEIQPGEMIGILGPTGSGKSTLLLLLQKLYLPSSGQIYFDDLEIREIDREALRRQVGLIMQESYIYSRSIAKNIQLPRQSAEQNEIEHSAKSAFLHDDVQKFSRGYETLVGERGVTLSGGQKQRLAIARSLIRDCPILIFDDSLSAIDADTDQKIRQELKTRSERLTTLIVSHRISSLQDCDRILVLDHGRREAYGPPELLQREAGLYQRVYDLQSAWNLPSETAAGVEQKREKSTEN